MEIEVLPLTCRASIERASSFALNAQHKLRERPILQHFLHDLRFLQEGVPYLEASHLKIEAPAHGLINGNDAVCNLHSAIGGIDQCVRRRLPRQLPGAVMSSQDGQDTLERVAD